MDIGHYDIYYNTSNMEANCKQITHVFYDLINEPEGNDKVQKKKKISFDFIRRS